MTWDQEKFLVTGATGFIGGRVCERLVQAGAKNVCALVHSPHRAARIARLPIQRCPGDLLRPESLTAPVMQSTVVIHCGLAQASGIPRGTENLLQIAARTQLRRFVHVSTTAVYGETPPPGCETETARFRKTGDAYCDNKGRAERIALRYARGGVPVAVLRPSIVYGPYSSWNTRVLPELREARCVLIDGGRGACNTTYVDNLVDAIFLSLETDSAIGEVFTITDGERITWGDFIRAHVRMTGDDIALPEVSSAEVREYFGEQGGILMGSLRALPRALRSREFRNVLLQVPICERLLKSSWQWLESLPEERRQRIRARFGVRRPKLQASPSRAMPDEVTFRTQTGSVFFDISKARKRLGYSPRISFQEGMQRVEAWLRFAHAL